MLDTGDLVIAVHSVSLSFCLRFSFECEWHFGHTQVTQNTIWPFTLKNINIFYFEMSCKIAIRLFSIKSTKISEQLNGNLAVHKSFDCSHSNSKANGIWGIQNTPIACIGISVLRENLYLYLGFSGSPVNIRLLPFSLAHSFSHFRLNLSSIDVACVFAHVTW